LASAVALASVVAVVLTGDPSMAQGTRLSVIRQRGTLVCGMAPGVTGFGQTDSQGRYTGIDADICRAVAVAIFGSPDQVAFQQVQSLADFQGSSNIDLVSRRVTWALEQEARGFGLLFGPVNFYDGQAFLVQASGRNQTVADLSNARICVIAGSINEAGLTTYFKWHNLTLQKVLIANTDQLEADLSTGGRCDAYTADESELGALKRAFNRGQSFQILSEQISNEPLAQLVRATDIDLFQVLRWTITALRSAEELNITSTNASGQQNSPNPDVQRLLAGNPGNGSALGLDDAWAYNVIRAVGNYGEVLDRNLATNGNGPARLPRGVNALQSEGGLTFVAPPQ
jgi:general L-amino acid transport system substrate-binding protein